MNVNPETLADGIQHHTNGSLRAIAEYDKRDYTIHYFRDDIESTYTQDEIEAIINELVMGSLGSEHFESLFKAGEFECSMFGFEDAVMFHFLLSSTKGVFITVDRDVKLNLDSFIKTCKTNIPRP